MVFDVFVLTPLRGLFLASATSAGFVASMYAPRAARRPDYKREDPANIRARVGCATATTALACVCAALAHPADGAPYATIAERYGVGAPAATQALAVGASFCYVSVLFLGVIAAKWFDGDLSLAAVAAAPRTLLRALNPAGDATAMGNLRNYVAGPITEELIFRACCCYFVTFAGTGASMPACMVVSAVLFALAHVHHLFRFVTAEKKGWRAALAVIGSNLVIHTVFALYSTFLYMRTGSLAAAVLAHSYCNWLGPPHAEFLDQGRDVAERRIIGGCYAVGITGYFASAAALTSPATYGSPFYR